MAINLGSAYGKVSLDASGVQTGVQSAQKSLLSLTEVGIKLGQGLSNAGKALTVGLTLPIVAFGVASVKAAMDSESALANLKATLASTNGVAGVTYEQLTKNAAALQKVTKFSDETIINGQAMLLTFTKIGKDVFPQATEAMLNMGEKFGNVQNASIQLGKALNDPIGGVSALRRVGVMLSDQQEKQIKDFMAVNDIASAQKVILKELETEFGGLAIAAGKTPAGQWAIFLNQLDELKETIGRIILPVLIDFMNHITKIFQIFQALPPGVQQAIVIFLALAAALGPILFLLGNIITFVLTLSEFIGFLAEAGITIGGISAALGTVGTTITATLLPAIGSVVVAFAPVILTVLAVVAVIALLYIAWKKNLFGIQDLVAKSAAGYRQTWQRFTDWWRAESQSAAEAVQKTFASLPGTVQATFQNMIRSASVAWSSFTSWLGNALAQTRNYIAGAFGNANWSQIGKNILWGIANGLLLGLPNLLSIVVKVATEVLAQIKKSLGIASPSKEAMKLGAFTAQGFALGMQTMKPDEIARSLTKPITQNANSQQQNISMQFANGVTIQQVRSMIDQNSEAMMNTIIGALSNG